MAPSRVSPLMTLLGAVFLFASHVFAASAVLGVDLGTEYIKASLVKPGKPLDIVLTKDSRRKETSAVAFKPARGGAQPGEFPERAYGADATALAARFPGDVYPNLKTVLGLPVGESVVQEYAARHPALQLQAHATRDTAAFKSKAFTAEEEAWMVEELLAMELQGIQKNAEVAAEDGTLIRSIVLTVPPFYTADEKRAIQTAADLAGLKVLGLISDGLAVGLNFATSRKFPNVSEGSKPEFHMVFDMGAGSTKATVIKFQSRVVKDVGKYNKTVQEAQVLGAGWDRTLGGDALNNIIIDDMVAQFVDSKGAKKISVKAEDVKAHGRAIAKLTNQVGKVRHVLSANQNTQASFEGLYEDVDFKYKITRAEFEEKAEGHAERITVAVNDALKMSGLDILDLDSVILHGGASRTPFVQKALEKILGSADKIRTNVNADEAAVFGAAFRGAELSPGFLVKEIRISEGGMYPAGIKWTNSKEKAQRQRLWTASSVQGGVAKEVTFADMDDFTATFYQQVGEVDKDVAAVATKNLTATVAALKEKYPSCVESDIRFKLGVKLNAETGEVEVTKASVECEAEISTKDAFVDGVKNLFGFGGKKDKDQEALKDDAEAEGSEEELKKDSAKSSTSSETSSESSTATEAESSSTASAEEAKADTKRRELVSIPVKVELEKAGIPVLSKEQLVKSKDRLKAFAASDKARLQREEALNKLEAFAYKIRDLLEGESFIAASSEEERTTLGEAASKISDWLYEEGADASKDDFKAKYKSLQELVTPIQKRITEAEQRPKELEALKTMLDQTKDFYENTKKEIEEYENWHASASSSASSSATESPSTSSDTAKESATGDFDGLEDEDAKPAREMEDIIKEKGPIPPPYGIEDLAEIIEVHQMTVEWLDEIEPRQAALNPADNPVLLIKDIQSKVEKLDKAGAALALKVTRRMEQVKKAEKAAAKDKSKGKGKKGKTGKVKGPDGEELPINFDMEELLKKLKQKGAGGAGADDANIEDLLREFGGTKEDIKAGKKPKGDKGDKGGDKKDEKKDSKSEKPKKAEKAKKDTKSEEKSEHDEL